MSYNYDINPWDDNYATSQPQQNAAADYGSYGQQQQQPVTPYGYDENNNTYGQQTTNYQYQEQQQQPQEQLHSNDPQGETQETDEPQGWLSRLFGRLCPFCCGPKGCRTGLPFVDAIVQSINKDLLISKVFYFFFYSAFGSLFPLMGVYFKQLGMNPAQVGILTGVRPFIEIFSAPFWHSLAERFHKSKALLIFSLISWIVFTYSLAHIRPPASACVAFNDSVYLLYTPYSRNDLSNYDVGGLESIDERNKNAEENPNEVFMNKPPQLSEIEGKDAILASEENQNDQRRRRRRKRQAYKFEDDNEHSVDSRYAYTLDSTPLNQLHEDESSEFELDSGVELDESLFEKRPSLSLYDKISNPVMPAKLEVEDDNEAEEEVAGESKRPSRFIWARSRRDTKEDDLLGESDEAEQEDDKSATMKNAKQQKVNKNTEEEPEEDQDEQDDTDNEVESRRKQSAATTAPPAPPPPTTTAAKMEPEEKTEGSPLSQPAKSRRVYKQRHKTPPTHIVGMSPITVEYAANYNKDKHSSFVTPMFSTIVYKLDDIKEVFFLLLLLISLGEFFSAPALTLADSATLAYLGDNTDLYGRQRLFGSLSWAITLLLVGMALDNATSIADHPCGPHPRERSYTVCFAIFSLLMACALVTATQFRFSYPKSNSALNNQQALIVASTTDSKTIVTKTLDGNAVDDLYASTQPRSIFNTAPPVNAPTPNPTDGPTGRDKFEYLEKWKSAVFAQNTKELPEWVNVFRQFKNPLHLMYLFITWFLGCGVGLVFTFLFWHLQDVGGTPTLFGICSVINHISEILAYFFSFSFIKRFGHTKVLSFGLGCNVIRFLYVAFLTNPYYALPFELVQGITHAACFAACCSYISHISKPELRTSTQGVMQGLHHGIGRACGTIIGGYMINAIGSRASFCIYGLLSGCVLGGFLYLRKKQSETEEEEVKVDDSEALGGYGAPQGVPSAIPVNQSQTQQDIDYQW